MIVITINVNFSYERFLKNRINPIGSKIINIGIMDHPKNFEKLLIPVMNENPGELLINCSPEFTSELFCGVKNKSAVIKTRLNIDEPGSISSLWIAIGVITIKNKKPAIKYFIIDYLSFLNLKINTSNIPKNKNIPSGRIIVANPVITNDR